jgi:hypothetical protein
MFLQDIHDAPKEVARLIGNLDQLHGTLDHVRQLIEQQYIILRRPGSPGFITKALENCEKQVKALESFANQARSCCNDQQKWRRTWASMKMVAKRQDLDDIQSRLRDAKMDLQFAISSNSWQLQYLYETIFPSRVFTDDRTECITFKASDLSSIEHRRITASNPWPQVRVSVKSQARLDI